MCKRKIISPIFQSVSNEKFSQNYILPKDSGYNFRSLNMYEDERYNLLKYLLDLINFWLNNLMWIY